MKIKNSILIFLSVPLFTLSGHGQTTLTYSIAKWYDNKKAAASVTFDDAINGQFTEALPIMDVANIKGTFFLTSQNVISQLGGWPVVLKASRGGHEIANHTISHPSLGDLSVSDINKEIKGCNDAILANTKIKSLSMAYPNGSGGGNGVNDQKVRDVAKKYFIGARAVGGDYNDYNFFEDEENYFKVRSPMINEGTSSSSFAGMITNAINVEGWFCPTYHGVVNGWIIVSEALFQAHMNELGGKKDDLWISTFAPILKYHRERKSAKLVQVSESDKSWVLNLSDTLSDNTLWNQPLTLNVDIPSWPSFDVVIPNHPYIYEITIPNLATSVAQNMVLQNISIFPNPATSSISVSGLLMQKATYEIMVLEGKVLQTGIINDGNIYIESIQPGIYVIKIKSESGDKVMRFVKE